MGQGIRIANLPDASIDAISGATQKPGPIELSWNCTDADGKPVLPGVYTYKVEGNISWEKRVLWEGKIEVGSKPSTSSATPTFIPDRFSESSRFRHRPRTTSSFDSDSGVQQHLI